MGVKIESESERESGSESGASARELQPVAWLRDDPAQPARVLGTP